MAYILTQKLKAMSNIKFKELFIRHKANSTIQATGITCQPNTVFNVGTNCFGYDTLLVIRMKDRRAISHLTAAHSRDYVTDWRINPDPTLVASTGKYPGRGYGAKS
ncbi:MAG: hypothetical protein ACQEP2_03075 [Actinomycetota bacterium]